MPGTNVLLPSFELPDGAGGERGTITTPRREILLVTLHAAGCAPCDRMRDALGRLDGTLRERGVRVLELADERPSRRAAVRDRAREVSRAIATRLGRDPGEALGIAADRFGEVFAVRSVHEHDPGGLAAGLLEWIDYVQLRCPECGAPEW